MFLSLVGSPSASQPALMDPAKKLRSESEKKKEEMSEVLFASSAASGKHVVCVRPLLWSRENHRI